MAEDTFKVVSVLDPGIDTARMTAKQYREYIETRDHAKLAPFYKPGARVTEYACREVPHSLWERFVMTPDSEPERLRRAFQAGVLTVKNVPQRDGSFIEEFAPTRVNDLLADETLDRFSAADRAEVGLVIWQRSFLAPRTVPRYLLPPTVAECLGGLEFRPAEPSPTSQATISSEASSPKAATPATPEPTASQPDSCDDATAPATAATATERTTAAAV